MRISPNYSFCKKDNPVFKAKFDLKVIQGNLNIPLLKMDKFTRFFADVGTDKDTVEALVRYTPSNKTGYNSLSVDLISVIGGKPEFYNSSRLHQLSDAKLTPENLIYGICYDKFCRKTKSFERIHNFALHKNN